MASPLRAAHRHHEDNDAGPRVVEPDAVEREGAGFDLQMRGYARDQVEQRIGEWATAYDALELERRLVDHGADGAAFPTSVATGANSGVAGHRPTDRRVEEGDFLTVRLGARYRGYRCRIGRTRNK